MYLLEYSIIVYIFFYSAPNSESELQELSSTGTTAIYNYNITGNPNIGGRDVATIGGDQINSMTQPSAAGKRLKQGKLGTVQCIKYVPTT